MTSNMGGPRPRTEIQATMRTPQTRMTLAVVLALGTGTLAALAVTPSSKDRTAFDRAGATPATSRVEAMPRVDVDLDRPMILDRAPATRPDHPVLAVARDGRIRFDVSEVVALEVGDRVDLAVRRGMPPHAFVVKRSRRTTGDGRWWQLESKDGGLVTATLAHRDGMVAGWMQVPGENAGMEWTLVPIAPGLVAPEAKAADLPGCGGAIVPDVGPQDPMGPMSPFDAGGIAGDDEVEECAGCAATVADIAFFYTSLCLKMEEARIFEQGGDPEDAPAAIAAVCELESANCSITMANSEVPFGTRPVYVGLVEWDEKSDSLLGPFTNPTDGVIDEVHEIRDAVGADACSLVSHTDGEDPAVGYCGLAYVVNGNNADFAFNSLVRGCMGYSLFAHEFGHNIGLLHAVGDSATGDGPPCDPWEPTWVGCCKPGESDETDDGRRYQHGWRNVGSTTFCFKTVMAYSPGNGILHYSNPEVPYDGVATGSPEDSSDGRAADNAGWATLTMPGTAAYRCAVPEQTGTDGRLIAGGLQAYDFFGISIATNGLRMMAGASRHDARGVNAGAAYVFEDFLDDGDDDGDGDGDGDGGGEDEQSEEGWLQSAKVTPTYLREGDRFGESIAADGDFLVIGSPRAGRWVTEIDEDTGEEYDVLEAASAGEVSVWFWSGDYYCLLQRIQPEDLADDDWFGHAVAISDGLMVIGAPRRDVDPDANDETGAAYVYRFDGVRFEPLPGEDGFLPGDDAGDLAGWSVGAGTEGGNFPTRYVMVGAPEADSGRGKVVPYVYISGVDAVRRSDLDLGAQDAKFGWSIAMEGRDAVVGAPEADEARGAAVAYRVVDNEFDEIEPLSFSGSMPGDRFGAAVAVSTNYIAVGAPDSGGDLFDLVGAIGIYERAGNGWDQVQVVRPAGLEPGDRIGESVAIVGNIVFAGAPLADDAGPLSGVVYAVQIQFFDCNENLIDDSIDIYLGISEDFDGDGIPDECESGDCAADLNGDGMVNGEDFGILLIFWGPAEPGTPADLNEDGEVNAADLGLVLASFNTECEDTP